MPDRILYGVQRIADHLGLTRRQAAYQIEQGRLPTFKMGVLVCATPEALAEHFAKLHAQSAGGADE